MKWEKEMTIQIAATVTAIVVLTIILITLYVGKSAKEKSDDFKPALGKIRNTYFALLLVVIVGLLSLTLNSEAMPYIQTKSKKADVVVNVTGRVWSWELSQNQVVAGQTVEFAVQSEDVTHGFGVYNSEGQIVTQVQVMPGYTNRLQYTFDEAGEYKILCMEYCGMSHQNMIESFTVVASDKAGNNEVIEAPADATKADTSEKGENQ